MLHVFTYIWTMISTSIIALYDGNDYYNDINVPRWMKIILVLPIKRERRIPRYIIVVHGIMQVFTVFFLISLLFCKDNIYISRIYGMFLFLGCIPCVLILQKLHSKKYNEKYGINAENIYCLKYHINDGKCVKTIYEQSTVDYKIAILWDGNYLSYCLLESKNTRYGVRYRVRDVLRLKKRMLCFEKEPSEGVNFERKKNGLNSSTEYFACKVIREFYEPNAIDQKGFPYVCVSCNPNIDKIEIDGEMVNVLGEKRIGEWVFYIFSYNVKGGGLPF